jgi:hypothetical protein
MLTIGAESRPAILIAEDVLTVESKRIMPRWRSPHG